MKNILLLSNSTMPGEEYFQWPRPHIRDFIGTQHLNLVFIPFAGITLSYDDYFDSISKIFTTLGCTVKSLHRESDKQLAMKETDGIVVGGGNTFQLLKLLYEFHLIDVIREKVARGIPFIGWSAGSNICCPTIMTTNDMPVVQPPSFNALGLIPFQINPHYTEATIPNHGGESRELRLKEFIEVNRDMYVTGLPEGSLLEIKNGTIALKGSKPIKVFKYGKAPVEYHPGEDINWLLRL